MGASKNRAGFLLCGTSIACRGSVSTDTSPLIACLGCMNQFCLFAALILGSWMVHAADTRKPSEVRLGNVLNGREIYVQSCAMCHSAGVGGAPRPGKGEDWAERAKKGPAELMVSVLRGKRGMPPKGGNASLTRVEAYLALDYMLNGDK